MKQDFNGSCELLPWMLGLIARIEENGDQTP